MCSCYRSNKNPQTVKLTPRSSPKLLGRYANSQTPKRPNRPHIPSFPSMSKSTDTKITEPPIPWRFPQPRIQIVSQGPSDPSLPLPASPTPLPLRSTFRSASVRRYLGGAADGRKWKNHRTTTFFPNGRKFRDLAGLRAILCRMPQRSGNYLARWPAPTPVRRAFPMSRSTRRPRRRTPRIA
jgi:hypothetical protein